MVIHETAEISGKVGKGTNVWKGAHIREGAIVGENCNIGQCAYIGKNVTVGNNCKIQNHVSVFNGVTIEDDVFLGPNMTFTNDLYPRAENSDFKIIKTLVKKGASIGANATIVCGVTIGEYAMVAAGGVVTKDVPAYALVMGNPARVVGEVDKEGKRK